MIFFLPNFDVRKEQVSNTKREHGQTDARKPSKSILTKNDPARIQTRKASNGCTKSLKSDFPTRSRSQPFAEARRDKRGARPTQKQTAWLDREKRIKHKDDNDDRSRHSYRCERSRFENNCMIKFPRTTKGMMMTKTGKKSRSPTYNPRVGLDPKIVAKRELCEGWLLTVVMRMRS